jgi:hypothetical protein
METVVCEDVVVRWWRWGWWWWGRWRRRRWR